ncbi:MAG: cytochrome c [Nitrospira sp.]|jgi:mono/diheme cytochrome c family protein|nr:cytochrome c [Nitrospira sp.]
MKPMLTVAAILLFATTSLVSAQVMRGNPQAGQAVYEQQCLRCHGTKLEGNGPDSQDLVIRPANLRSLSTRAKTDWELLIAISNGVLFSPMHGFRGKLTDQQLLDVLSYIRSVAPPDITS